MTTMNDASSSVNSCRKQEKDIPQWLQIKPKAPSPQRKTRLKGAVPSPPEGEPIVIGRGKNKIALSWELPEDKGDSDIVAYKIEMCRPSVGQWEQVGVTIDTTFEVYNLKTNVEYLFRVSAMNKAGWSAPSCMSRSVRTVSDAEPPEFRQKLPQNVEFTCGQVLKLEVRVTGVPEPDVKWYKNGAEILNNHVHHIIPGYREHHALIITLTGENDQGRYTCKAFNSAGEANTRTLLAFIVPDVDDHEARLRRQRLLAATYAITDEEEDEEPQELVDMAPEVILKLRNRTVKERSDIKLTTRILAVPESNVTWFKDGKPVTETDNLKIFIENGLHCLEIIETKENDSGVYSVVAVNPLGSTTCKAELVVEGTKKYFSPVFSNPLENYEVKEGTTVFYRTKVTGYPEPEIMWIKNGRHIKSSKKYQLDQAENGVCSLTVKDADPNDSGTFTCIASNGVGDSYCSGKLFVYASKHKRRVGEYDEDWGPSRRRKTRRGDEAPDSGLFPPVFLTKPAETDAIEGDNVEFLCEVRGNPIPIVVWKKEGITLRETVHFQRHQEGEWYTLEIPDVQIDDTAWYLVLAKNGLGYATCLVSLQVCAKGTDKALQMDAWRAALRSRKPATKPEFSRHLRDQQCADGESVTFECVVNAVPTPTVRWEHDNKAIKSSEDFKITFDGEVCRLRIADVFPEDEGEYSCIADNEAGRAVTSAALLVDVDEEMEDAKAKKPSGKAKDDLLAPKVLQPLKDQEAAEHTTARLECQIIGEPEPEITWYKDEREVKENYRIRIEFTDDDICSLVIKDVKVQDKGKYTVEARNKLGKASCCCEFRIEGLPIKTDKVMKSTAIFRGISPSKTYKKEEPSYSKYSKAVAPQFYIKPRRQAVDEKGIVKLKCAVLGTPEPTVKWDRHGTSIESGGRFKIYSLQDLHFLEITNVDIIDAGKYTCTVSNVAGSDSASAELEVKASKSSRGEKPRFTKPLIDKTVNEGDRVCFDCSYTGTPEPSIRWYKSGKQIQPSPDFRISYDGSISRLDVVEAFLDDSGEIVCEAKNTSGEARTVAKLTVKETVKRITSTPKKTEPSMAAVSTPKSKKDPAQFTEELQDREVMDGDQVTLTVKVKGTPPIDIIWLFNNKEIKNSKAFKYISNGDTHSLVIDEVFPEDSGVYICEAYNDFGDADTCCKLKVKELPPVKYKTSPPVFQEKPRTLEVDESSNVKFTCIVNGNPAPTVEWEKSGRNVLGGARIKIINKDNHYTFEIPHALSTDAGSYTVIAKNSLGEVRSDFSLKVKQLEIVESNELQKLFTSKFGARRSVVNGDANQKPRFITELCNKCVKEGTSVIFDCCITGVPIPKITWFLNNKEIKESKFFKMNYINNKAEILIVEAYSEDEGEYECKASNCVGEVSFKATLTIKKEKDKNLGLKPPRIENCPDSLTAVKGKPLCMKVNFVGTPEPAVRWFKDNKELRGTFKLPIKISHGVSELNLRDVQPDDRGKYMIIVENSHGSCKHSISLSIEDVPEPPAGKPSVTHVTETSVTLSWSGPCYDGGSAIKGYNVEVCKAKDKKWKTVLASCHSTSCIVKKLEPRNEYIFRVRAENIHGLSLPGQQSDIILTVVKIQDAGLKTERLARNEVIVEENPDKPHQLVTIVPDRLLTAHYEVLEEVGKGRFGIVHRCVYKSTSRNCAAKYLRCPRGTDRDEALRELEIMNELYHPTLLKLVDAFEGPKEVVIVTEYIPGGELFERVVADDFVLTEKDCIMFMRQICEGVQYMHSKSILHLDLKPENVLCISKNSNQIKIIDFGLARKYDPKENIKIMFGTPEFVAPEVINFEPIGFPTDMWSIGVICYILLSGLSPFLGDNDQETFSNVTACDWDFEDETFLAISNRAKDFIERLLVKKKENRNSVKKSLEHRWLAQDAKTMKSIKLSTDKHKKFLARRKWQKTGNAIRAIGRMASLRNSLSLSPSTPGENNISHHVLSEIFKVQTEKNALAEETTNEEVEKPCNNIQHTALPKFLQEIVKEVDVVEGSAVKYQVKISGTPEPDVDWYRDGELVQEDRRHKIEYEEDGIWSLVILDVEEEDEGDYECVAKNSSGKVSCTSELFVLVPGNV